MQQSTEPEFDLLERQQIFQRVMRVWRPHLSRSERDLLLYLIDNTVSWGRSVLRVKLDQLVTGTAAIPACGLSRATMYRALAQLRIYGIVEVHTNFHRTTLTLNPNLNPPTMLAKPKRLTKPAPVRASVFTSDGFQSGFSTNTYSGELSQIETAAMIKMRQQPSQIETHKKDSSSQDSSLQPTLAPSARAAGGITAREAISKVAADRKARHAADRSTATAWVDAWVAAFPAVHCPSWGRDDIAMMSKLYQRSGMCEADWLNFITWVVGNWSEIRAVGFAWMTKRASPERPVPRFIVKFATKLFDLHASWSTDRRLALATGEAAELERLVASGLSQEQALIELGKRRAIAEHRDTIARDRAEAGRLMRTAQRGQTPVPKRVQKTPRALQVEHGTNPYEAEQVDLPVVEHVRWEDES